MWRDESRPRHNQRLATFRWREMFGRAPVSQQLPQNPQNRAHSAGRFLELRLAGLLGEIAESRADVSPNGRLERRHRGPIPVPSPPQSWMYAASPAPCRAAAARDLPLISRRVFDTFLACTSEAASTGRPPNGRGYRRADADGPNDPTPRPSIATVKPRPGVFRCA